MMYRFKCKAAGDLIMTQADGDELLRIIGKTPAAEGIIEVAAVSAAIQALENAVAREQANRHQAGKQVSPQPDDAPTEDDDVELHQRIWPLVEMLKRARDEREVIVWGV
jgi:protein-tyrosine phosphatase